MRKFHQRCEGKNIVIRAVQIVEEHHKKRTPTLASAHQKVSGRSIDLVQEIILDHSRPHDRIFPVFINFFWKNGL